MREQQKVHTESGQKNSLVTKHWLETVGDTLTTLARFPFAHPKACGILFLTISGRVISHVLANSNSEASTVANRDESDWQNDFSLVYGDYNTADISIYAENHLFHSETWKAIDAWNASIVLVESVPSGVKIPCEDRMSEPHINSPSFNPVCIGWDTHNSAFYQKLLNGRILHLIRQLVRDYQILKSMFNDDFGLFYTFIREAKKPYRECFEQLEKEYGFSYWNVPEPRTYSFKEFEYRYNYIFFRLLINMTDAYILKKAEQQIFDESLAEFSQHNTDWDENEILERNTALVKTTEMHATTKQKTAIIAGSSHVISYIIGGDDLAPETKKSIHYLWSFIERDDMKNRVAVLATLHDGLRGSLYPTAEHARLAREYEDKYVRVDNDAQQQIVSRSEYTSMRRG